MKITRLDFDRSPLASWYVGRAQMLRIIRPMVKPEFLPFINRTIRDQARFAVRWVKETNA